MLTHDHTECPLRVDHDDDNEKDDDEENDDDDESLMVMEFFQRRKMIRFRLRKLVIRVQMLPM